MEFLTKVVSTWSVTHKVHCVDSCLTNMLTAFEEPCHFSILKPALIMFACLHFSDCLPRAGR